MLRAALASLLVASPLAAAAPVDRIDDTAPPEAREARSTGGAFASLAEVASALSPDGGEPPVLLHVGHGRLGYDRGHLPGAMYVPHDLAMTETPSRINGLAEDMDVVGPARRLGLDASSDVVLYGDANGVFPAPLRLLLERLGIRARLLDGHLRGWEAAGLPLETQPPASPLASSFEPPAAADRPGVRATREEAQAPGVVLVDVRPAREFDGEKPGHSVQRPGHIPGAVSLPWADCFTGNRPPLLADRTALRTRLEAAGVTPDRSVIVYDGIGTHAALGQAILTELGHSGVRVLEGGYAGWDAAGLPVE